MKRLAIGGAAVVIAAIAIWFFAHATGGGDGGSPAPSATDTPLADESAPPQDVASIAESPSPTPASPAIAIGEPLAWAKSTRRDFGCMLERDTGYKDPLWGCDSDEKLLDHPCDEVEGYWRGPQFPPELVGRVNPLLRSIELHWEHRQLQEIDLIFRPGVDDGQIKDAYDLPATLRVPLDQVQSLDITECVPGSHCLIVKGFDHGDIDCGDGRRPD